MTPALGEHRSPYQRNDIHAATCSGTVGAKLLPNISSPQKPHSRRDRPSAGMRRHPRPTSYPTRASHFASISRSLALCSGVTVGSRGRERMSSARFAARSPSVSPPAASQFSRR